MSHIEAKTMENQWDMHVPFVPIKTDQRGQVCPIYQIVQIP